MKINNINLLWWLVIFIIIGIIITSYFSGMF